MGKKVNELTEITTPADDDLVVISDDGITSKKIQKSNLSPIKSVNGQTGVVVLTQDDIESGDDNLQFTQEDQDNLDKASISPFVRVEDSHFYLKGQDFKFVGGNYYRLFIDAASKIQTQKLLDAARLKGITVLRAWFFEPAIAFRHYDYSLGTNLITNGTFETNTTGWTLGSGFTRSSEDAHSGTYSVKQVSASGFAFMQSDTITVSTNTNYVLTFWTKFTNNSGFGVSVYADESVPSIIAIEDFGFLGNTNGEWKKKQFIFNSATATGVRIKFGNQGGDNLAFYDDIHLGLAPTPTLVYDEDILERCDMVFDEARQRGVKIILSLMDSNEFNYNSKHTYVGWANTIYAAGLTDSFPYIGFFTSEYCKDIYKDFIATMTSRVNTVNGLIYKDDPTIFAWELGNEIRLNRDDPSGINSPSCANIALLSGPDGWADEMSTYIKSQDPNHLVTFGDMAHTWTYSNVGSDEDAVSNGSYYGVDYRVLIALPNIDYLDFHIYPNQGNGEGFGYNTGGSIRGWGYRLGFPPLALDTPSGDGFRAQIKDFIDVAHAAGKPAICGETGIEVEYTPEGDYPLYNRYTYFLNFFQDFFDLADGGDGVLPWSLVSGGNSTTFDIALSANGGEALTDNTNDTTLVNLFEKYNDKFQLNLLTSQEELDLRYVEGDLADGIADGDYQGFTQKGTAGAALVFGQLCYLDAATSRWKLVDADLNTGYDKKLGICVLAASGNGKSTKLLMIGTVRADATFPTFDVGAPVYMSSTAGAVSSAKPTATGAAHRVIGYGDNANQLFFQPAGNFQLVS